MCHPTCTRQVVADAAKDTACGCRGRRRLDLMPPLCRMMLSDMKPIRKAIFPVAGLGTRFLPATKAMPKEMLPVVDRPLIQHVVDEAREAGIEHFIFVTGRNKGVIEDHFDRQFELEVTLHGAQQDRRPRSCCRSDLPEPGTASFTRQQSPLGLGHAVWCARELVGHEPFALLLPDVLVQHKPGCLAQMIDAYSDARRERQHHRGRGGADGPHRTSTAWSASARRKGKTFAITEMVEKPPREKAPSNLIITGRYILQPEIFDLLETQERRRRRRNPDHRLDDQARQDAAVLRPEVRRPQLRLRLQDRLPRRQRRLCAGAPRPRPGASRRDQDAAQGAV